MYEMIYIIAIGVVAGIIHQLIDRAKENEGMAFLRGAIVGGAAAWLTSVVNLGLTGYAAAFTAGYFGDSVILNIAEQMGKKE